MNPLDLSPVAQLAALAAKKPCILVVDDQPVNIQALHTVFSGDYRVLMATSGEQALKLAHERQPDLILLDVAMPGMDGHTVCQQLKIDAATAAIPIIFVTAQTGAEEEEEGLSLGAVDFITKPFNPTVVRARVRTHITLKHQSDLLRQMAFVDGLTGLANRRAFDERLTMEAARARRSGEALAVAMIDVDHFKLYNDHYGHQQGDGCLVSVARAVRHALMRPADLAARWGGEEFACVLPGTDEAGSQLLGERIRDAVQKLAIAHEASPVASCVTVSIGIAVIPPRRANATFSGPPPVVEPARLIAQADRLLYHAKQEGRNRVSVGPL